jgi:DmsE family decaheme c-type cytochrome
MAGNNLTACIVLCGMLLACCGAWAQHESGCLDCHEAGVDSPAHAIFKTVHGSLNGGGAAVCTTCHGSSEAHDRRGKKAPVDVGFGPLWTSDVDTRNASCQSCHDNGDQLLWVGSAHQQDNLACNDCHQSHQQKDLSSKGADSQSLCLDCHTRVRAELQLPSHHPIATGKTDCVDCHNPHGGHGDAALHQVTLNDNCFSCHQDKRGPFLWEHPPAAEDCSLCHRPHGSVNERLLTARGPALCQQCHVAAFHPSVPYGGEGLAGGTANQNVLGKNCLNCHSQTHGSNHPSGARLTR